MLTDGVDGPAEGEEPETVLENPPGVEKGECDPQNSLEPPLEAPQPRSRRVRDLLEKLVLPKTEHRDQRGAGKWGERVGGHPEIWGILKFWELC